ncbi:Uncharacterized conserved protein YbaA, DUF1428 family [Halogranum rubrum]|uniref:Uncharacterized conserved protein YbaA, DUF1428 family n=1 Tax=Halogranum rubrum TaxID=553466 RepID=A0A1I4CMN1_9EURY|nr:DUF1428 domain-containing protein [Halogranum rubrum]SFK81910.1 Uncharacterized conserved protein YbaA, DUF1428 family [Halogranum rubrum]
MSRYVDGYVLSVPNDKLDTYREMADEAGELWIKHGALEYFEGVGDDMDPDMGDMPVRTFPQLTESGEEESVVFSYIVFESREHRDEVNAKVMQDPAMDPESVDEEMPFDPKRMTYGGFRSLVSHGN